MSFDVTTVGKPVKIYSNMKCDGCGVLLKNALSHAIDGSDEYVASCLQPDDAIILRMDGGYGMAIDPCCDTSDSSVYTKIFCKDCLKKLCEQWPTFLDTIKKEGCSSSIGHCCAKVKDFVWEPYCCCYSYCRGCGKTGSLMLGSEVEGDIYSRRIVNCLTGCGLTAPGLWAWEIKNFYWSVEEWDEQSHKTKTLQNFVSEESANLMCENAKSCSKEPLNFTISRRACV